MDYLKSPWSIGSVKLSSNVLYAPLAGCSDLPFRRMTYRYRPGIAYCEMVKIDALVRNDPYTYRLLDYDPTMHPIGAQICGSKVDMAAQAAKIVEDLGFDVIDFNCGCPVDKVTRDGSGSGMLKNPEYIGEILAKIVSSVKIPVTLKIRAGWDEESIYAPRITQIAELAGASAIAVHGRTREQGYKGPANWDYIRACKQAAKKIPVIGNGDVFDPPSALRMFEYTGCDGVLVARGTLGQPWIAEDIIRLLSGSLPLVRGVNEIRSALMEHLQEIVRYQNDVQSLLDFRRVGCWYLKRCIGAKPLRIALNQCKTPSEAFALIERFSWDQLSVAETVEYAV